MLYHAFALSALLVPLRAGAFAQGGDAMSDESSCNASSASRAAVSGANHHLLIQLKKDVKAQEVQQTSGCCGGCSARSFCSPRSGNCYDAKVKSYYETCSASTKPETSGGGVAQCCSSCGGSSFCSPVSGGCYDTKRKEYYATCPPCEGRDCPIGWKTSGITSGGGQWCEVGRPSLDWPALKTCPSGTDVITVKVLTYNLFWWNLFGQRSGEDGRAGRKVATTASPEEYDLMGFQECDDISRLMRDAHAHGLTGEYGTIDGGRALAIAYRKSRWTLVDSGKADVGEDSWQQYYGKRRAHWARLRHTSGAVVFFANHHGPLPVSIGGGCAGSATAYNIMRLIAQNARPGDAIILVGDFNAQPHSSRIKALDSYMHRVFTGTSHHGVDHIYSNCGGSSVASTSNVGSGGSDHDALNAVFRIPKPAEQQPAESTE